MPADIKAYVLVNSYAENIDGHIIVIAIEE